MKSEDWIYKCEKFALNLYGEKIRGFRVYDLTSKTSIIDFASCDKALSKEELKVCR